MRGLRPRPTPGRPPQLDASEKRELISLLKAGSLEAGYKTDMWTLRRVAQVIEQNFGVNYHPCHVWRVLHGMNWSCQKPERRALQRNEKQIAAWKVVRWEGIKKNEQTWGPSGLRG